MTRDAPSEKKRARPRKRRVVLALLLVLGIAGWRYGWPARSWETKVYPLEEIEWRTAAQLAPRCFGSAYGAGSARNAWLVEGSLGEAEKPAFDFKSLRYMPAESARIYRESVQELVLPGLSGRSFRAGIFWVDEPAGYGVAQQAYAPTAAYAVLLMCDLSKRIEEAAELIVDTNRNRDLTDDPVMKLSNVWRHDDGNPPADLKWHVRIFEPITLARDADARAAAEGMPATVRAVPTLTVTYYNGQPTPDKVNLEFSPASFRKGRITRGRAVQDVVITPDRTRLGCFNGPSPASWTIGGDDYPRFPLTAWVYERGTFWGFTLDREARELLDGPYRGPSGTLRAETANGEPLRIGSFSLWLRAEDPHQIISAGWAPIPRFESLRLAHRKQPLPVGDYGLSQMTLVPSLNGYIRIKSHRRAIAVAPGEFSIDEAKTTVYRLPSVLKLTVYAAIEERPRPYVIDQAWWTASDDPNQQLQGEWKGPQPGSAIKIGASMSDPASGNSYSLYYRTRVPPDSLRLVIRDESGNIIHQGSMEYG